MADEGMSEDEAQALAIAVRRAIDHEVAVQAEGAFYVVEIRRADPGDSFILRHPQDWEWLGPRIREAQ